MLILASHSPRRCQLLRDAGYLFSIMPPDEIHEKMFESSVAATRLSTEEYVRQLALIKAASVVIRLLDDQVAFQTSGRSIVLACDSIVDCQGKRIGKPKDRDDARKILQFLSGTLHRVLTGICLWSVPDNRVETAVEISTLRMEPLTAEMIESYLESDLWEGKAGAFGYQDENDWLILEKGSESNVVGLPMEKMTEILSTYIQ